MSPRLLPLFLLTASISCSGDRSYPDRTDERAEGYPSVTIEATETTPGVRSQSVDTVLHGVLVAAPEDLGMPAAIGVAGEYLVVLDNLGDSVLMIMARSDGKVLGSLGRRGRGPGEFWGAWSLDVPKPELPEVWVYDLSLRRMIRYDLDSALQTGAHTTSLNLSSDATVYDPVWVGDQIVTLGFFPNGRLRLFNSEGRTVATVGSLPRTQEDVPPTVLAHAYQGFLRAAPERNRFVVANRHASVLELYDSAWRLVGQVDGPVPVSPNFRVVRGARGPVMGTDIDFRFAYVGLAVSSTEIFALFSGRVRRDHPPGEATLGMAVHVFAWDGTLKRVLQLDSPASAIALDPSRRVLYATRVVPTPGVVRYELPP